MNSNLAGMFGLPGGSEWVLIIIAGLLLFGRRLPEVGRSLGRTIVEFKKGIRGIEDDVDQASKGPPSPPTTGGSQPSSTTPSGKSSSETH